MTDRERVIVSAYTGVLMCDFHDLHKFIEEKMGRPVLTHEFANEDILKEIRARTKQDFLGLCKEMEQNDKEIENEKISD